MDTPLNNSEIIEKTLEFVKENQQKDEGAHDYWHIIRVWNNAKHIAKTEDVNGLVIELAALLHDIADYKFHGGDESVGPRIAVDFLTSLDVSSDIVKHVEQIILNMSFKGGSELKTFDTLELRVVQDADRLDAIGATGIARAFTYGGYVNRPIYDPTISPKLNMTPEEYKNYNSNSINHFYEKLLLLKDKIYTESAKAIALKRHLFLETFLDEFHKEWNGEL